MIEPAPSNVITRLHGAKARDHDPDRNPDPDRMCRVNAGPVPMRNTHVRMDSDPHPFSFGARVNAT